MIIAEAENNIQFISQPDHSDLAGQFADHWGNDRFDRPDSAGAIIAAYNHDIGWWEYDRRPHLDEDGLPIDFSETPAETWIRIYDQGIDSVVEVDAYAGLLVSLHGSGLRRQQYGLSPSWPDTSSEYLEFVKRQEDRQARLFSELQDRGSLSELDADLLSTLHASGAVSGKHNSRVWNDYKLLEAWDALSLAFCTTRSPPGFSEIESVPSGIGATEETLSLEPVGADEFRMTPYPFDRTPLMVSVPSRTVDKERFDDDDSIVQTYYRADRKLKEFTIHPSE